MFLQELISIHNFTKNICKFKEFQDQTNIHIHLPCSSHIGNSHETSHQLNNKQHSERLIVPHANFATQIVAWLMSNILIEIVNFFNIYFWCLQIYNISCLAKSIHNTLFWPSQYRTHFLKINIKFYKKRYINKTRTNNFIFPEMTLKSVTNYRVKINCISQ